MKIMQLCFSFNSGGIENLIVDIFNNWDNSEDKLYLCVINDDLNDILFNRINSTSIKLCLQRKKKSKEFSWLLKLIYYIKKNKISIVHCNSPAAARVCFLLKLFCPRVKFFYTVHDVGIYSTKYCIEPKIHNIIFSKIIAISETVKRDILKSNNLEDNVIVLNNAIDLSKFDAEPREIRKENCILGCVGRIAPEKKGQDLLLKAIKKLKVQYPQLKCHFFGEPMKGHENLLDELKDLAITLGVENHVVFEGNSNTIPSVLAKIDILVVPSRYEGFGIVVLEGMASYRPVIASDIDGPKEIIKVDNNYGILFESENVDDLSQKIAYQIENYNYQKVINAYNHIYNTYSIQVLIGKLRRLYNGV